MAGGTLPTHDVSFRQTVVEQSPHLSNLVRELTIHLGSRVDDALIDSVTNSLCRVEALSIKGPWTDLLDMDAAPFWRLIQLPTLRSLSLRAVTLPLVLLSYATSKLSRFSIGDVYLDHDPRTAHGHPFLRVRSGNLPVMDHLTLLSLSEETCGWLLDKDTQQDLRHLQRLDLHISGITVEQCPSVIRGMTFWSTLRHLELKWMPRSAGLTPVDLTVLPALTTLTIHLDLRFCLAADGRMLARPASTLPPALRRSSG
ncbi:hypothetical protein C8R47DRAFT_1077522 [Mycena vitilis]|nr:hypothetical protein C8R47DRAFT_1077522 [Mycena vitilis]